MSFEAYGVRVSGSWRFSSGIENATWLILNAPCPNHPDAERTPRFLLLVAAHKVQKNALLIHPQTDDLNSIAHEACRHAAN